MAEGDGPQAYAQQQYGYDGGFEDERGMHEGEYDQYGDAEEPEGYYTVEERGPGGVVHHHHYYHAPPTAAFANHHAAEHYLEEPGFGQQRSVSPAPQLPLASAPAGGPA